MRAARRLLFVDDDASLREMLAEQLRLHEEFEVDLAATGTEGLALASADHYDVVIVDVGLPDVDGREVCRLMRAAGVKCPIILLTAATGGSDSILGLDSGANDSGANDTVAKPFRLNVLLARLRAQIRQHERSDDATFAIGPYTFQPSTRILVHNETHKKIHLTDKEAGILKYLHRAGGRAVRREVLLDQVWGYNAQVTTHTLETHVYRLRRKIEPDPAAARILVTEPGGYRLVL